MNILASFTCFSDLPEDIGRTAFELAAQNGDALPCSLVSKTVRSWVEPIIYRKVVLEDQATRDLFCRTLLDPETQKPPEFFATHVRILVIASIPLNHETVSALKICRGIQTLVIWARCSDRELQELFSASEALLTPARLSVFNDPFPESKYRFHYPIFRNVTHLDLVCDDEHAWKEDRFSQLGHLTHLSLDIRYTVTSAVQLVGDVLHACLPSLRILVIWLNLGHFRDEDKCFIDLKAISTGEVDIRAVAGCINGFALPDATICCASDELLRGWAAGGTGGFWTEAEAIVHGRRQRLE